MQNTNKNHILDVKIVTLKQVKTSSATFNKQVEFPQSIVNMLKPTFNGLDREIFVVVGLNTCHFPTIINTVAIGSTNQISIKPNEVFKPLLLSNSVKFIGIHNHPAGSLEPSVSDIKLTQELIKCGQILGVKMLDHLIINDELDFCSLKSESYCNWY